MRNHVTRKRAAKTEPLVFTERDQGMIALGVGLGLETAARALAEMIEPGTRRAIEDGVLRGLLRKDSHA